MTAPNALMAHALMPSVWLKSNAKAMTARDRLDLKLSLKKDNSERILLLRPRLNLKFTAKPKPKLRLTPSPKLRDNQETKHKLPFLAKLGPKPNPKTS